MLNNSNYQPYKNARISYRQKTQRDVLFGGINQLPLQYSYSIPP
jgi:hypothetical protein